MALDRPRHGGAPGSAGGRLRRVLHPLTGIAAIVALGACGPSFADGSAAGPDATAPTATEPAPDPADRSPEPADPDDEVIGPSVDTTDTDLATAPDDAVFPPRELRVPSLDIDAPVGAIGLLPDRTVDVPDDIDLAGWYDRLAQPGDPGVTVVVGHVDGRDGPGVFHGLETLEPGDRVEMVRGDRGVVAYEIVEVTSYPKDGFPTREVFGDPRDEVLQLVTCGGSFDRDARSYTDNIVATALPVT